MKFFKIQIAPFFLSLLFLNGELSAKGRYAEIVIPFKKKIPFFYEEDLKENALVLTFKDALSEELAPIHLYDERVVRRVLIESHQPKSVRSFIYLKDRNLKSSIQEYSDPYRVVIQIFDSDFEPEVDQETHLPITKMPNENNKADHHEAEIAPETFEPLETTKNSPAHKKLSSSKSTETSLKLLQPEPGIERDDHQWAEWIESTPIGRGSGWANFPAYLYPLVTAPYEGRASEVASSLETQESPVQRLAQYGWKQYRIGDERRALIIYQKVLFEDPSLFDKDPLYLWSFAEAHLGQNNTGLSDRYFKKLVTQNPDHPLARFASLRRLDLKALKSIKDKSYASFETLLPSLESLTLTGNQEFKAQVLIRKAFWGHPSVHERRDLLPELEHDFTQDLAKIVPEVESQRTSFLASSLVLYQILRVPLENQEGTFQKINSYFKTYRNDGANPYFLSLKNLLIQSLSQSIRDLFEKKSFSEIVKLRKSIEVETLKDQDLEQDVRWILAESLREEKEYAKAFTAYLDLKKSSVDKVSQWKSLHWVLSLSKKGNLSKDDLLVESKDFVSLWTAMDPETQKTLFSTYQQTMETMARDTILFKGPGMILADLLSASFPSKENSFYSSSPSTFFLLHDLMEVTAKTAMNQERSKLRKLLTQMKRENMEQDPSAQNLWLEDLVKYAEDLRFDGNYTEAGSLYIFASDAKNNWEKRAEALYKGGLLLFRGGKREEALVAFNKASQDGNNLFYANLAKERLNQLSNL